MSVHAGHRLLRHLRSRGIDRLHLTPGSDFAPLVQAYAIGGDDLPVPVLCLEENVAIGMAHGRALATGQPQAAMVHVTVGTAKALCGLINAAHDRTPLLLLAGRNPVTEQGHLGSRSMYIHWSQEMYDQGGMVREFVKWDYELRDASQVEQALDRALAISCSEPRGPAYLTLPREVLASTVPESAPPAAALAVPTPAAPDPGVLAELAALVANARQPMVIASDVGLLAADRQALADFADQHAVGVVESNRALTSNLDVSHPSHLGFDVAVALQHADLVIVAGAVVPWIPSLQGPRPGCRVVHVGPDPLFSAVPFRAFPADLHVTSSYRPLFEALGREAARSSTPDRIAARRADLAGLKGARQAAVQACRPGAPRAAGKIDKAFASAALAQVMPQGSVVISEYWFDRDAGPTTGHGSYFYQSPAGGLGWGVPAALGVQSAQPGRAVVAAVGDGAYVFANPAACHHAAANERLPILIAVYNNARWGSVETSAQQVYPELEINAARALPLSGLGQLPDFTAYARASGGHGESVSDPSELVPALQRCFEAMAQGRHALINILAS
jgi:acetolactate synthase-1/2/3 large subunit